MKYLFEEEGWENYQYWLKHDRQKIKKINELLKDISRSPFEGLGNPEPLKHELAGYWSRRIDKEHRLVYIVQGDAVVIMKCRFHYRE